MIYDYIDDDLIEEESQDELMRKQTEMKDICRAEKAIKTKRKIQNVVKFDIKNLEIKKDDSDDEELEEVYKLSQTQIDNIIFEINNAFLYFANYIVERDEDITVHECMKKIMKMYRNNKFTEIGETDNEYFLRCWYDSLSEEEDFDYEQTELKYILTKYLFKNS